MKKILLIPTYHYLSNPLYKALYKMLNDEYHFTYFFPKDSTMIKGNLQYISYDKIGYIFDEYIEMDYDAPWVEGLKILEDRDKQLLNKIKFKETPEEEELEEGLEEELEEKPEEGNIFLKTGRFIKRGTRRLYIFIRGKIIGVIRKVKRKIMRWRNLWNQLMRIKYYSNRFREMIEEISPDIIVMTSDMTISYRIVKKYFPNVKIIIMQPCFLDFREKEKKAISGLNKAKQFLIGNILYPRQQYFGLENDSDILLLIEDKFLNFYANKRTNVHKIINPYYYDLNREVKKIKKNKNAILKKLNLPIEKDIIIIFLTDYTSIHGKELQKYLESSYIKIINRYSSHFTFIIKNHPRAGVKNFDNKVTNAYFIKDEVNFSELLSIADLNISINSNASLEAIVSGMLTLNFLPLELKNNNHYKWLTYYGGYNVSTYEDICDYLESFKIKKQILISNLNIGRMRLIGKDNECRTLLKKHFN